MGLLPAFQHNFDFDFAAFGQEFLSLILLEFQIVVVCPDAETDAFDVRFFLFGLVLAILSGFLVLIFPEIHNLAHRRNGLRGNFHQVEQLLFSNPQSLVRIQDSELFSVFTDDADFARKDIFIDPSAQFFLFRKMFFVCSSNGWWC